VCRGGCPTQAAFTQLLLLLLLLQAEVEAFYVSNGYLLPQYHQFYWFGYRKVMSWLLVARTP
jgi:hypothetical protein